MWPPGREDKNNNNNNSDNIDKNSSIASDNNSSSNSIKKNNKISESNKSDSRSKEVSLPPATTTSSTILANTSRLNLGIAK